LTPKVAYTFVSLKHQLMFFSFLLFCSILFASFEQIFEPAELSCVSHQNSGEPRLPHCLEHQ